MLISVESGIATSSCARAGACIRCLAPAHEDVASGGRRRRNLSWVTLQFCFGSSRRERCQEASSAEGTTPWERSRRRRKKRTVPVVNGDLVGTAADSEVMRRGTGTDTGTGTGTDEEESRKRKGLRLPGCCFLAPARAPGREVRSKWRLDAIY